MTARETIENLWDRAIPVGPLLDQYAHELAEQIRNELDFVDPSWMAADLIDPEEN